MFNKKTSFILILSLIILLVGTVNATNTNQTHENTQTTHITTQEINTPQTTTPKNTIKKEENKNNIKKQDITKNTTINVNSGNYNKYFNSRGRLYSSVTENSTIILNGEFTAKNFEISKPRIYLTGENATIKNGQIRVAEEGINSTITNITITIKDTTLTTAIDNKAIGTTIINNKISIIKDEGATYAIHNIEDNITIINNTITLVGPAPNIDWSGFSEYYGQVNTSAILSCGDNIIIDSNIVDVAKSNNSENFKYGTIDALNIDGNNVNITNNFIKTTGGRFTGAISGSKMRHSNISNNNITMFGERYLGAIGTPSAMDLRITNNNIYCYCHNTTIFTDDDESLSYGICVSSYGGWQQGSEVYILNNTINLDTTIGYGMEIYTATNNMIYDNKININATAYASGIVFAHSPKHYVINNTINTTANSSIPTNMIVEEIAPSNKGIGIQQNSNNITIANNIIKTVDFGNNAYSIYANSSENILIENNTLDTNTKQAIDSIGFNALNVTINNITTSITGKKNANIILSMPSSIKYNGKVNITAVVVDAQSQKVISNGKVVFKINGKTIKINNKNTIFLNQNGSVSIIYNMKGFTPKNYTITAVFGSNNLYDRIENSTILKVNKLNVLLNTKKLTVYSGQKILINETLYDENNKQLVGINKVSIKFNGKTIQHTTIKDGKLCIYVQIPKTTKAGSNKLEIVIGENSYYLNKRCNYTITTIKQKPVFKIEKVEAYKGEYITLKSTIKTNVTCDPAMSGLYSFKINGITQHDMDVNGNINTNKLRVVNGVGMIHLYLPFNMKCKDYNITITFSGNGYMESGRFTSNCLTVKF